MNVTFEESPLSSPSRARSGMIGFLMRNRIVTTVSQAQILLLALAVVIFVFSGMLLKASIATETIDTSRNFIPAVPSLH
ncbi:MAG: hypothetical protein KBD16_00890 [Candidatus Pacebacteria bacterium]|nr:hypothetical protein [Candidatus Paceibacterota bacterium]